MDTPSPPSGSPLLTFDSATLSTSSPSPSSIFGSLPSGHSSSSSSVHSSPSYSTGSLEVEAHAGVRPRRCDAVIFDLGDVLFSWSADTPTVISPKVLHKILRSATWFEYEKGNLSEQEAYERVAAEFKVPTSEVAAAFQSARDTLKASPDMVDLIRELRGEGDLQIFAMSNISAPDWEVLRGKADPADWALFDRVFTSAEAHERKPNLGYYRQVLAATNLTPTTTAFVDDKLENVLSARSLGLHGITFDSFESVSRQLKNLVGDPITRGKRYMKANAKQMRSVTDGGVVLSENFAQLLILEATEDESLVDYIKYPRLFNFFQGKGVLTSAAFPCDLDTTSIGLTVSSHIDDATKHSVMDEMLTYKNKDDIIQTYFDSTRPRIDPIVCVNVLTFFYSNGRGDELSATLDWVYSVLKHRAYRDGTLYYYGPDTFLFFLSRLLSISPEVHKRFSPLFSRRIVERFGVEGDCMALAMRVLAASRVQFCDVQDYEKLLQLQEADGSWPIGWVYKYGGADILIGSKGLTTALAVQAIEAAESLNPTV